MIDLKPRTKFRPAASTKTTQAAARSVKSRVGARRVWRGPDGRLWLVVKSRGTSIQKGSRRCTSLRLESSSYLLHSEIEPPSQQESQRSTVLVSDLCGNLFDTCLAGLQEMHRPFNA